MRILFYCITIFYLNSISAQTQDRMTNDFLKHADATYKKPSGYTEKDSLRKMYTPFKGNHIGLIPVNLVNDSKDILIGIFFTPYKETSESKKRLMLKLHNATYPNQKKELKNFDDLANYWDNIITGNIDTLQGRAEGLDEFYEKKNNTDTLVVFPMKITNPYHAKYNRCKYLIAHKKDRGIARIFYFYTSATDPKIIDEEISQTYDLIKFN